MQNNFQACLDFTLHPDQDGQPLHVTPGDPGGATAYGITLNTMSRWLGQPATISDLANLTTVVAGAIYVSYYWKPISGDGLPLGIDLMVFDCAVNCGVRGASVHLQQAVGISGDEADGVIGPDTLACLASFDKAKAIELISNRQQFYYRSCSGFSLFGDGWLARLERRTKTALAMLQSPVPQR